MEKKYTNSKKSKLFVRQLLSIVFVLFTSVFSEQIYGQCTSTDCTYNPTSGSFTSGVLCFTTDTTLNSGLTINGADICIAPGVTVTINNGLTVSGNVEINVEGTLIASKIQNNEVNLEVKERGK